MAQATADTSVVGSLAAELESWYRRHRRDLPWRRLGTGYAVWVSEVMLQQTQVDTVVPYFERFMARFPTVEALAEADEHDVMQHWSGLGYYRRARYLHAGAKAMHAQHTGGLPSDAAALRALPGIGEYTAGAIASIAFGQPEPIVDGNVARVLSRLDGIEAQLGSRESQRALWARARALVSESESPGDFNQGLMELGALVCRKAQPRCGVCPWQASCYAAEHGLTGSLPRPAARKAPKRVALDAWVITDGQHVWLEASRDGLFPGLWGPLLRQPDETAPATGKHVANVRHTLTHRRLEVRVFAAESTEPPAATLRRVEQGALPAQPLSALARRIFAAAGLSPQSTLPLDLTLDVNASPGDASGAEPLEVGGPV